MLWFISVLILGMVLGILVQHFFLPPIPLPDKGHRLFGVVNEKAHHALLKTLSMEGHHPVWAFDSGATHQTVMADGLTVIAWFNDEDPTIKGLPRNAYSLAVFNPKLSAMVAVEILTANGFTTEMHELNMEGVELVMITSNAFIDNALIYRKPFYKLPTPKRRTLPDYRRVTKDFKHIGIYTGG